MSAFDGARFFHINVNCRDLDRSRAFYEALGLTAGVRTAPDAPQPGLAFGLREARWDAWIMTGAKGFDGSAIDLLEWKVPEPAGAPPASLAETGWQRFGIATRDFDDALVRVAQLGGEVWAPPHTHTLDSGASLRIAMISDPDGTAIELIEGSAARISFAAVSCRNLERSLASYEALGFRELMRFSGEGEDGAHLRFDGAYAMDEVMLSAPGGGEANLLLVHVRQPGPVVTKARPANTLGMWRSAFLVPDVDAAWAALDEVDGVARLSPPVTMRMGDGLPELRFGCLRGPDGEVLELIESRQ
jgi:catechol 2,3-dioxygenase-like lactoylglutathione lyase family enzyme